MSLRELAETLLRDVQATEAAKQYQRRKAMEAEERRRLEEEEERRATRQRQLMEERQRREDEEARRRAQMEVDQSFQRAKQGKQLEYLVYFERFHDLKKGGEEIKEQAIRSGYAAFRAEAAQEAFMNVSMKNWPEPYRSKCRFTPEEKLAFLADPYQSAWWVKFLP